MRQLVNRIRRLNNQIQNEPDEKTRIHLRSERTRIEMELMSTVPQHLDEQLQKIDEAMENTTDIAKRFALMREKFKFLDNIEDTIRGNSFAMMTSMVLNSLSEKLGLDEIIDTSRLTEGVGENLANGQYNTLVTDDPRSTLITFLSTLTKAHSKQKVT